MKPRDGDGLDAALKRPLEELLPHRAPMLLITRVLGLEGESFLAEVDITETSPFYGGGGVPAWIGLEYMAQTVAAYAGAEGAASGGRVRSGLLLGARAYAAHRDRFLAGETLRVSARKLLHQEGGLSVMECSIQDLGGRVLASSQLTVVQGDGGEAGFGAVRP